MNYKETKLYKAAFVIGRFQIPHNGHVSLFKQAAELSDTIYVMIGSSSIARNTKNPFSFCERAKLLQKILKPLFKTVVCCPVVDDLYSDKNWATQIKSYLKDYNNKDVILVGHNKDESSYYLRMFPEYAYHEARMTHKIDATVLRARYFGTEKCFIHVPQETTEFLNEFEKTEAFTNLKEEFHFLEKYKKQFAAMPYPPIFTTVDAVVVCGTNILLTQRGANPGKGLWALPGGFLEQNERVIDGILRELIEETDIDVSDADLRSALRLVDYFDAPGRSLRGRTISFGGLIVLERNELPKIRGDQVEREHDGSVGAAKSFWVDLAEVRANPQKFFDDHPSIINRLTAQIR